MQDELISRQAAIEAFKPRGIAEDVWQECHEYRLLSSLPTVKPQEPYDFAKWVANEIFDDMWEYNKDAFAEIACRKLEKMGIVRAKGDEWELIEPQEVREVI